MNKERIDKLKQKIKNFKTEIKTCKSVIKQLESETVAGWYSDENVDNWLGYFDGIKFIYGFDGGGDWFESTSISSTEYGLNQGDTPATDKEVETALIAEAKKRGFKEGVSIKGVITGNSHCLKGMPKYESKSALPSRVNNLSYDWTMVFQQGKWAEIIKTTHVPEGDYTTAQLKDLVILSENK